MNHQGEPNDQCCVSKKGFFKGGSYPTYGRQPQAKYFVLQIQMVVPLPAGPCTGLPGGILCAYFDNIRAALMDSERPPSTLSLGCNDIYILFDGRKILFCICLDKINAIPGIYEVIDCHHILRCIHHCRCLKQ